MAYKTKTSRGHDHQNTLKKKEDKKTAGGKKRKRKIVIANQTNNKKSAYILMKHCHRHQFPDRAFGYNLDRYHD